MFLFRILILTLLISLLGAKTMGPRKCKVETPQRLIQNGRLKSLDAGYTVQDRKVEIPLILYFPTQHGIMEGSSSKNSE